MSHCVACHTFLHIVLLFVMSMCSIYLKGIMWGNMCSFRGPQSHSGMQYVHITNQDFFSFFHL